MRLKPLLSFFCFALLLPAATRGLAQDIVINEIMSDNDLTIEDEFGANADWIEIYNRDTLPVNLGAYYLSDDLLDLMEWNIPDYELDPG